LAQKKEYRLARGRSINGGQHEKGVGGKRGRTSEEGGAGSLRGGSGIMGLA